MSLIKISRVLILFFSAVTLPAPEKSMIVYSADAIIVGELSGRDWTDNRTHASVSGSIIVQDVLYGNVMKTSTLHYRYTCPKRICGKVERLQQFFDAHAKGAGIWYLRSVPGGSWISASSEASDDGFRALTDEQLSYTRATIKRRIDQRDRK